MENRFYGFQFASGTRTTSGTPNEKTGRMNIAGAIFVFDKKENARKWAASAEHCTMQTKAELRTKCLGISVHDFNEILRSARSYDQGEE